MPLPPFPPLRTERLVVRPVTADDLDDLLAVNGDPEVTRFLPYDTWQGPADARAWFDRMATLTADGQAHQLVFEHAGRAVGTALLFRHDEPSARIELGYVLGRAHWGRGLAHEAIAAVLDQVFGPFGLRRVEAQVQPDNRASNALLARLGFRHEGVLRERWVAKGRAYDVNAWGLLAEEWRAAPAAAACDDASITTHDDPPPADRDVVDAGIGISNDAAAPLHEVRPLAAFARTPDGMVIGGAVGRRWGACCELQQLWVAPAQRRRGLGAALVRALEEHARRHGCRRFFLETFSFQAPAFYRALGYRAAFRLDAYPHGIVRHLMVKDDDAAGRPADRFDHAFLEPASFDATVGFYRDGLGWTERFAWGGPGTPRGIGLDGGGTSVVIAERHAADDHSKSHGIAGTRPTLHLVVDDLDARHAELAAKGLALFAPETSHWGVRWFVARDPDGNLIAFEEARPR